jgi:hypothetical protein
MQASDEGAGRTKDENNTTTDESNTDQTKETFFPLLLGIDIDIDLDTPLTNNALW